jgi:hypothetical protein
MNPEPGTVNPEPGTVNPEPKNIIIQFVIKVNRATNIPMHTG